MNSLVKVTVAAAQVKYKNKQQQSVFLPPQGSCGDTCCEAQLPRSPQKSLMCCRLLQHDLTTLALSHKDNILGVHFFGSVEPLMVQNNHVCKGAFNYQVKNFVFISSSFYGQKILSTFSQFWLSSYTKGFLFMPMTSWLTAVKIRRVLGISGHHLNGVAECEA